jgi:hypothetical protein
MRPRIVVMIVEAWAYAVGIIEVWERIHKFLVAEFDIILIFII